MTPIRSDDLTELIEEERGEFVVMRSPDSAAYDPDYEEIGRFPTRLQAEEFLASTEFE
ncbi:hypothetical protein ACVILK_006345 [Bradyrhizobium embrapense]